jgi:POT family proton-dependent oligopeptide transporter
MTKQLHFTQADTSLVFGLYSAACFDPHAGGLADRWLGKRRAILIGGAVMALGHPGLGVAVPTPVWP